MIRAIYLDVAPLSLVTQRKKKNSLIEAAHNWLEELIRQDIDVYLPEIIDYEIRRELVRTKKQEGIERLNGWQSTCNFVPITSQAMVRAAQLWADARNRGVPTAEDCALDADVIFAAQVLENAEANGLNKGEYLVATENVHHISRYMDCALWHEIVI